MARQGKLHSSPFHVETAQYKYAVEHDMDERLLAREVPDCDSLDKTKTICNKWNSGQVKCASYRCLFMNRERQRATTCEECSFCFKEVCYHQRRPSRDEFRPDEASFCCYYLSMDMDAKKFNYIRWCCARFYYTQAAKGCEKRIKSKNKYIKEARIEISSLSTDSKDWNYLSKKIKQKDLERIEQELLLEEYVSAIDSLGGRLEKLPWFTAGHSKNSRRKEHQNGVKNKKH